jgi:hypothetical protein
VLVRLAPLRVPTDTDVARGTAARHRRRRRSAWIVVVQLLLLGAGAYAAAAVLTGEGSRGDAALLLGAVAVAGTAEVLRRALARSGSRVVDDPSTRPESGPVEDAGATSPAPAETEPAVAGDGHARHDDAGQVRSEHREPGAGSAGPVFTGVWSARGAVRPEVRRVPTTRCAQPPAQDTPEPDAAEGSRPRATVTDGDADIDLTREVLAALHAGNGD